jgi:hypothetical protein
MFGTSTKYVHAKVPSEEYINRFRFIGKLMERQLNSHKSSVRDYLAITGSQTVRTGHISMNQPVRTYVGKVLGKRLRLRDVLKQLMKNYHVKRFGLIVKEIGQLNPISDLGLSALCCSGINIDSMVIHAKPDQMAS